MEWETQSKKSKFKKIKKIGREGRKKRERERWGGKEGERKKRRIKVQRGEPMGGGFLPHCFPPVSRIGMKHKRTQNKTLR